MEGIVRFMTVEKKFASNYNTISNCAFVYVSHIMFLMGAAAAPETAEDAGHVIKRDNYHEQA